MSETNAVQIDRKHSRAICAEIGERLRNSSSAEHQPLPPQLSDLLERLQELDGR